MHQLAVFTKPWKALPLPQLARHIQSLGFDLIELPVRPGFQVEPATIERDLPAAVKLLGEHGIRVLNVTADLPLDDERLYSACAQAGIKNESGHVLAARPELLGSGSGSAPPTRRRPAPMRAV